MFKTTFGFRKTLGFKKTFGFKKTWALVTLCGLGFAGFSQAYAQPAPQLPPRSTQWERSAKTMYDLVTEGFELKATRNNHGLVALNAAATRPLTYYHLQKGGALALCIEDLGTNLGNRAQPGPASFACYMLSRPTAPADQPRR